MIEEQIIIPPDIYRADSRTLRNVMSQFRNTSQSPIQNAITGQGTARDPGSYDQIMPVFSLLHEERNNLYRNVRIARNVVCVYPEEASWFYVSLGSRDYKKKNSDAEKIRNYFTDLKTGSLERKVRIASIEARLHGESWLLLGINDGQSFDKPLKEDQIKSFEWVEVFPYHRVKINKENAELFDIVLVNDSGFLSDYDTEDSTITGERVIVVHRSRMKKFIGDFCPPSVIEETGKHESSLQAAHNGIMKVVSGIEYSSAMLRDYSVFWYKLDGLSNLIRQGKQTEIYDRFATMQMAKNIFQGIAMDAKNEDAGFVQRSYGGVRDILEIIIDYMVATTGIVRYKILGTSTRAGLGAEGRGTQERLEHCLNIKSWQKFTWLDNLTEIVKLGLRAADSPTRGKVPKNLSLLFPPVLELTPEEIAELMNKNSAWIKTMIDAGVLNPLEARISVFGSSELILNPTIVLDDRITEMMTQKVNDQANGENIEKIQQQNEPVTSGENEKGTDDEPIDGIEEDLTRNRSDQSVLAASTENRNDEIDNLESWQDYIDEESGEWKNDGS